MTRACWPAVVDPDEHPTPVVPPRPGRKVMPCAGCKRMLDLKGMRHDRRAGWRRIVCRRCAS